MPFNVAFVAAIGRNSVGDWTARPKIESIVAKYGGKMGGGIGNSTNPLMASFAVKESAVNAAKDAWYLDDVEFAKVLETDVIPTAAIKESAEGAPKVEPTIAALIGHVAEGTMACCDAVAILMGQKPYTAPKVEPPAESNGDPKPLVSPGEPNPATATA